MKQKNMIVLFAILFVFNITNAQSNWVTFTKAIPEEPTITLLKSDTTAVIFRSETPGMYSEEINENSTVYQRLEFPDQIRTSIAGEPELPVIKQLIAVPDCDEISLSIQTNAPMTFDNYTVYPAPNYQEIQNPDSTVYMQEVFTKNDSMYAVNDFIPGIYAEIRRTGYMRSQRMVEVWIYPVQFNPVTNQLQVYTDIEISLNFTNATGSVCQNTGIFSNICQNSMLNYDQGGIGASVNDRAETPGTVDWITVDNTAGEITADYLIIAAPTFFNSQNQDLINIAQHRADYNGFDVAIVNVADVISDEVGYPYNPVFPQHKYYKRIRNFIKSVYENGTANNTYDGKLGYILIVGDDSVNVDYEVKAHIEWMIQQDPYPLDWLSVRNDYFYSCVTPDINGSDVIGDLFIGRFCCDTDTDLHNIVEKTIFHETEYSFAPWKKNILITAGDDVNYPQNEIDFNENADYIHSLVPLDFSVNKVKMSEVGYETAVQENISSLNEGYSIAHYIGHGSKVSWSSFKTWHFPQLNNYDKLGIIFSTACNTGYLNHTSDCMAEYFTNSDKGCVAFLGATHPVMSGVMIPFPKYLGDAIWGNMSHTTGEIVMEALSRSYDKKDDEGQASYVFTLFGDPAYNLFAEGFEISEDISVNDYISDLIISTDVTVKSGATLTIEYNSDLEFTENGKLIIEDGATLVLEDYVNIFGMFENNSIDIYGSIDFSYQNRVEPKINIFSDINLNNKTVFLNKGITIHPAGKLILAGSYLTNINSISPLWDGITVLGNKDFAQSEENQGWVELKNGSTITNAVCGIYVGDPNNYSASVGGIIRIENAVIKNCQIGIYLQPYRVSENISFIKHCAFETTNYLANLELVPNSFIYLHDVGSIQIEGNTFRNLNPEAYLISKRGIGLKSIDADYIVEPYCTNSLISPCPEEDLVSNLYENLYKGIEAQNTYRTTNVNIDQNEFINNFYGLFINTLDNIDVTSNTFTTDIINSIQFYIQGSEGFHIEANEFTGNTTGYGMLVEDCQGINEIYRNYFTDLQYGVMTYGDNTDMMSIDKGLQLLCNIFSGNQQQIWIHNTPGIAKYQGSKSIHSGNQFIPYCSGNYNEILNNGNNISYFGRYESYYMPSCVTPNVSLHVGNVNTCPSKLSGGMPTERMAVLDASILNTETELMSIVDGGDTESLNETVDETNPDEALKLRNELLSESPNLSDTVMIHSTTIEDVLPAIMLKEVLSNNPSAAKSDNVQTALNNRTDPLPQYMRDEIDQGRSILSYKEELESDLSGYNHERENILNRKINQLIQDGGEENLDTLENLLQSENKLHRKYQLVNLYMTQERYNEAQTMFENIPDDFELSSKQQNEYTLLNDFYSIYFDLKQEEKTWFDMTDEQKQIVYLLADDSTKQAGMRSRAVLSLVDGIDYGFPIPEIDLGENKGMNPDPIIYPETFAVFPNPANDYFIIEYALGEKEDLKDVSIALFNNKGAEVMNFELNTHANQLLAICDHLDPGIYWCRKINKGKVTNEEKVIIERDAVSENNSGKTSGYENEIGNNEFKLYPNPAKDYFIISYKLDDKTSKNNVIQITDSKGSIIKEIKVDDNTNKLTVSSSDWVKGVYTVNLISNEDIIESVTLVVK